MSLNPVFVVGEGQPGGEEMRCSSLVVSERSETKSSITVTLVLLSKTFSRPSYTVSDMPGSSLRRFSLWVLDEVSFISLSSCRGCL